WMKRNWRSLNRRLLLKTLADTRNCWRCWLEPKTAQTCPQTCAGATFWLLWRQPGNYWQNLFAALVAHAHTVALVNPLRTHRFAGEELARTKTDRIDCVQIARFGMQKYPAVAYLPDAVVEELRELVRLRARLIQDAVDRTNQLHRLVDLGFPEFT